MNIEGVRPISLSINRRLTSLLLWPTTCYQIVFHFFLSMKVVILFIDGKKLRYVLCHRTQRETNRHTKEYRIPALSDRMELLGGLSFDHSFAVAAHYVSIASIVPMSLAPCLRERCGVTAAAFTTPRYVDGRWGSPAATSDRHHIFVFLKDDLIVFVHVQ